MKINFRYRQIAYGIIVITSLIFTVIPDLLIREVILVIFIASTAVLIYVIVKRFMSSFRTLFGSMDITYCDFPDLRNLAKEMNVKLHKTKPFGITERKIFAQTNMVTDQIIFERVFVEKLEKLKPNILRAVGAHELTHIKNRHVLRNALVMVPALIMIFFFSYYGFSNYPVWVSPILIICPSTFAAVLLFMRVIFWQNEYESDLSSARIVGAIWMMEALEIMAQMDSTDGDIETHPSSKKRIERLSHLVTKN